MRENVLIEAYMYLSLNQLVFCCKVNMFHIIIHETKQNTYFIVGYKGALVLTAQL
jgi:hypothetical protein